MRKNGYVASQSDRDLPLTPREKQVVHLATQGFKNREIASALFISESTVKSHLRNVYSKLGVSNRVQLYSYVHAQDLAETRNAAYDEGWNDGIAWQRRRCLLKERT